MIFSWKNKHKNPPKNQKFRKGVWRTEGVPKRAYKVLPETHPILLRGHRKKGTEKRPESLVFVCRQPPPANPFSKPLKIYQEIQDVQADFLTGWLRNRTGTGNREPREPFFPNRKRNRNRRNRFPGTETGNGTVLSCSTVLKHGKTFFAEEPPEPKNGTARTVPSPNRNRTEPNWGLPVFDQNPLRFISILRYFCMQ